jgi:hypothetical protein
MLLFFDGFDHCTGNTVAMLTKWASSIGAADPHASGARTGPAGLWMTSGAADLLSKAFPASGGFLIGFALKNTAAGWGARDLLQVREGGTVHLTIYSDGAGHLAVTRNGTVLATGATVLSLNSFHYIEFKGVIHDSAGSYTLRINEAVELSASGIDTRNAGATGQWDRLYLGAASAGYAVDDLYVCDLSGASHNDFLGAVKVETLLPESGNGANVGLTPSTGTDHGALVDENPPNTTDYNGSATVGAKDTYTYPSLTLAGAVLAVQTNLYAAKSDAGTRTVCAVVRTGGTDYDGANVSPGTTFGYFPEVRPVNPATSAAWTIAEVNALEAGMKVTA